MRERLWLNLALLAVNRLNYLERNDNTKCWNPWTLGRKFSA